jgi:hypothetical protein
MRCLTTLMLSWVALTAVDAAEPTKESVAAETPPKVLNLRLGDIRRYLTPEEYRALLDAPALEANTVVVKADAPLLPMKSSHDIPGGILTPFWALANPHKIWRLVLPDPRIDITKIPPPDTPVPPREFRWGP